MVEPTGLAGFFLILGIGQDFEFPGFALQPDFKTFLWWKLIGQGIAAFDVVEIALRSEVGRLLQPRDGFCEQWVFDSAGAAAVNEGVTCAPSAVTAAEERRKLRRFIEGLA